MVFIRPYQPSDSDAVAHICRATLPEFLAADAEATRLAPYLWAHQYTYLSPAHCFVLEDPDASPAHPSKPVNKVVGYILGTPDIADFLARYHTYVDEVLSKEVARPPGPLQEWATPAGAVNPACLAQIAHDGEELLRTGREALCAAYPATLHVDILDGWRNGGLGAKLVERFLGSLPEGTPVHLAAAGTNTRVVPFYERCGFRVMPGGEKTGNIWMVREGG